MNTELKPFDFVLIGYLCYWLCLIGLQWCWFWEVHSQWAIQMPKPKLQWRCAERTKHCLSWTIVLRPFEVHHTNSDLKKLASTLKKLGGDIRIVVEHTSTYWRPIALTLKEADFFVSVVNAMLIHDFSDNTIRKLKTDRADALKIANYALTFWDTLPPFNNEEETRLLLKMQSRANERITATATALRNGLIALADQTFPGVA